MKITTISQPSGLRPGFELQKILHEPINVPEDPPAPIRYHHRPATIPHAKNSAFSQDPFEVANVFTSLWLGRGGGTECNQEDEDVIIHALQEYVRSHGRGESGASCSTSFIPEGGKSAGRRGVHFGGGVRGAGRFRFYEGGEIFSDAENRVESIGNGPVI